MPLFLYQSIKNAEIAIWQATEEMDFYAKELAQHGFPAEVANGIRRPEKKRQWYASRYLLCELFPGAIQAYQNKKPIIRNGPEISISHSGDMVAVMLSSFKSGIDIQTKNDKLLRIAPKFVNPSDLEATPIQEEEKQLRTIWSIKEAIFKRYITQLPFKQIHIEHYNPDTGMTRVTVERKEKQHTNRVVVKDLGDFTMAYVIE